MQPRAPVERHVRPICPSLVAKLQLQKRMSAQGIKDAGFYGCLAHLGSVPVLMRDSPPQRFEI